MISMGNFLPKNSSYGGYENVLKDNREMSINGEIQEYLNMDNTLQNQNFFQFSPKFSENYPLSRTTHYDHPNTYYIQNDDIQINERVYINQGMEMNRTNYNCNIYDYQTNNSISTQHSNNYHYHKEKSFTVPQFLPVNRQMYFYVTQEYSNRNEYGHPHINSQFSYEGGTSKKVSPHYSIPNHLVPEYRINDNNIPNGFNYFDVNIGPDEYQVKGWNITPTNILKINFQPSNSDVIVVSLRCDESMGLSDPDIFLGASSPKFNISSNNLLYLPFLKISKEMIQGPTKGFEFKLVYSLIINGKIVYSVFSRPFKIFANGTSNQNLSLNNHKSFHFVLKYDNSDPKRKKRNISKS